MADDSSHNNHVRQKWLSRHVGGDKDSATNNALTRSCQYKRGRHIRQVYQDQDDASSSNRDGKNKKPR